jgi:hypothetical protein
MAETEHPSFFRTHKMLAFLPLAMMGAGVWYYIQGRVAADHGALPPGSGPYSSSSRPFPGDEPGGNTADAAAPRASRPARQALPPPASLALPEVYDPEEGIAIQGPAEFKSQIMHALKLVWMADRDTFLFIKKNISSIRNENKTGFYRDGGRTVASLSSDHAFRSLTWCAGVLAHQAWHAWYELSSVKKVRRAPPLPGDRDGRLPEANPARVDYKGLDVILDTEDRAFAFQLDVLRKVGAPKKETDLILRRIPRDFTSAHDGSYALNP